MSNILNTSGLELDITQIYTTFNHFVAAILHKKGVLKADIEDISHEVFIIAQRRLSEYRAETKIELWLKGICIKTAANYRRKAYMKYTELYDFNDSPNIKELIDRSDTPDNRFFYKYGLTIVQSVLNKMPKSHRDIFQMYELEDLGCVNIAKELNIPIGTVYSRIHHARKLFNKEAKRYKDLTFKD